MAGSPFLERGFKPIRFEGEDADLAIEGRLPEGLNGTFLRVGPNPQFEPRPPYSPLHADGMIHAFRIGGGRVSWKNRWVRTAKWRLENAAGRALIGNPSDPRDRDPSVADAVLDGTGNTNLVAHAGRLLALEDGFAPIEVTADLETIGPWRFEERLPRNLTAHPKIDPESGEMWAFANFPAGRVSGHLAFYRIDAGGALVETRVIEGPFPAVVHDFAITERFLVVAFCPVTVSMKRAMAGLPPLAWEPELGTHVAMVPRDGGEARWWRAPSFMAWHYANAWDDAGRITVDVCQQDAAMYPRADGTPPGDRQATQRLTRWTMDWAAPGELETHTLWSDACEYPRIDERLTGRRHRSVYLATCGGPGTGDLFQRGIARADVETGAVDVWAAGSDQAVGEPVFVPRPGGSGETDGWVLTTVYDEGTDRTCLAVLDAGDLAAGPVARAHLQHRVPMGFHAIWTPA